MHICPAAGTATDKANWPASMGGRKRFTCFLVSKTFFFLQELPVTLLLHLAQVWHSQFYMDKQGKGADEGRTSGA